MQIRHGNLFDTKVNCIGHGVNCQGVMGAGIAKTFRSLYPANYEDYRATCLNNALVPGEVHYFFENDKHIFNLATQDKPGPDANYEWVHFAAFNAALYIKNVLGEDTLAVPQIGCGIGGLQWDKVEIILNAIEVLVEGFEFEMWIYDR